MGRLKNGIPEVVEHFTSSAGNYQPIENYGVPSQEKNVLGSESRDSTILSFSISTEALSKYHKNLKENSSWSMIMAYSLEDDFQHHSIMRTSVQIKL